jgi:hypothetical protein
MSKLYNLPSINLKLVPPIAQQSLEGFLRLKNLSGYKKLFVFLAFFVGALSLHAQTVTITGTPQPTANVSPGFRQRILYLFKVDVAGSAATLTGINGITTSGNYVTNDIRPSTNTPANRGFRLFHISPIGLTPNGNPDLPGTNQFVNTLESTIGGAGQFILNGNSTGSGQTISVNFASPLTLVVGRHFFYLTVDINTTATIGNTIGINAFNQSAFVFSGTPTVNPVSFPASGLQTFKNATLTITGVAPAAATIERGINHVPLYRVDVTTSGAATQIGEAYDGAQLRFHVDGSAIAPTGTTSSTTNFNKFRVVYSNDQVMDATDQVISGGTDATDKVVSAPNLPLGLPEGVTRSIFLTTQTLTTGTVGANVQVTNVTLNAAAGTTVVRGSIPVGGLQTLGSNVAKVALTAVRAAADPLLQGTINNHLGYVKVDVTDATTVLNRLAVNTSGVFLATDYTAFKLWASNSSTFDASTATLLNTLPSPGAFNGLNWGTNPPGLSPIQAITPTVKHYPLFTAGTTYYYHVTVDVAPGAKVGNTLGMGFNDAAANESNTIIPGVRTKNGPTGGLRPIAINAQIRTTSLINQALNLPRGATNQVLYKFKTAVSNTSATLSSITLNVNATSFSDIEGGYKLYYSSVSNFNLSTATQIGTTVTATANAQALSFTAAAPIDFAAGQEVFFYLVANTNAAATLGNTIIVNAPGEANFNFSSGVKTFTSTTTTHTISGPPQITLNATALPAENIANGTKNVMVYQVSMTAAVADADFTGITLKTAGSASNVSYRLYYSANAIFDKTDVQIGSAVSASGSNQDLVFNTSAPIRVELGTTATLFLIADVSANTQPGTVASIAAPENTNVRFMLGDVLGSPAAGALKSIVAPPVVTVNSLAPVTKSLPAGSRDFIAYRASLSVDSTAYVNLTGVSIQTKNTFQPADISGGFKFYLSADTTLDASDKLLGIAGIFVTPQQVVLNLPDPVKLTAGQKTNLIVATDLSPYATVGSQVQLEALSLSKLRFESSANTGTTQAGNIAVIGTVLPTSFPYKVVVNAPMVPGCNGAPAEAGKTGIIDITMPPYNADKTGVQDATAAFRAALGKPGQESIFTFLYIPNGTYLISDTIGFSPEYMPNPGTGRMGAGANNIQMWGESREGVKLILKSGSAAFQNANAPRAFFDTGRGSADRFGNSVSNLTIEVQAGNPGAIGLRHYLNNYGGLYNVTIRALGQAKIGLDKSYSRANGPSLTKDVLIEGFETGIATDFSVESEVYEHVTLKDQTQRAWFNGKQILAIRDLKVINCAGPAFVNEAGFVNILDGDLQGTGAAAIQNGEKGSLLVRNLKTSGYTASISDPQKPVAASTIAEYLSDPATGRDGQATTAATLNLPVKETPVIPWDAPSTWVNVGDFGATANGICNNVGINNCQPCDDDAPKIQAAIDATLPGGSRAGATTLFLPGNYRIKSSIRVRGSIRRILSPDRGVGGSASGYTEFDNLTPTPINWIIEAGTYPEVEFNSIRSGGPGLPGFPVFQNNSGRTVIFKNCTVPTLSVTGGEVFFESCALGYMDFTNVNVWGRQMNPEADAVKVTMNGGTLWTLGFKTEQVNSVFVAKNAKIEQFGGFIYSTHDSRSSTMYKFEDSEAAISSFEYLGYFGQPFMTLIEDTKAGNKAIISRVSEAVTNYPSTWSQFNDGTVNFAGFTPSNKVGSMFLLYRNTSTLNLAPTFALSQNELNVVETTGSVDSVANFATSMDDGNPESSQTLNFEVTTNNDALFSTLPAIDSLSGTLTYALKENASGTATVSVVLKDNGSNAAPSENSSEVKTFMLNVAPLAVPVISAGSSLTFCPGQSVVLTSTEAPAGATYQWFRSGTLLNGQTNRELTATLTGDYTVQVTYANGVKKTSVATSVNADDTVKPEVLAKNISVALVNGSAVITAVDVDNGSTDNCGIASLEVNKTTFGCNDIGNHTVTLTVVDKSGNTSSATATVTVTGSIPTPAIAVSRTDNTYTGLDPKTIALGYGAQSLTLTASNPASANSTYSWSPAAGLSNATSDSPVFTPTSAGSYTFTVNVTSESGCQASTSVTIKVIDVRCGNKNNKVLICKKEGSNKAKEGCIGAEGVADQLRSGAKLGSCATGMIASDGSERSALDAEVTSVRLTSYPNPFANQTTVSFSVPQAEQKVTLAIFDAVGNRITTLYSGKAEANVKNEFVFDSTALPAGAYFARLVTSTGSQTFKLIVAK